MGVGNLRVAGEGGCGGVGCCVGWGGSEGSVGRWWCGWVVCWFVRPDWGVPYFPVERIPVGVG